MRLPSTRPSRTITAVESECSTIFCASPPFMRVEPAITSGPVYGAIAISAPRASGESGSQVIAMRRAPT